MGFDFRKSSSGVGRILRSVSGLLLEEHPANRDPSFLPVLWSLRGCTARGSRDPTYLCSQKDQSRPEHVSGVLPEIEDCPAFLQAGVTPEPLQIGPGSKDQIEVVEPG